MEDLKKVAPVENFDWDAYENGETLIGVSHAVKKIEKYLEDEI